MWGDGVQVPVRVVLRGEADGWHCLIIDGAGTEERLCLGGSGVRWQTGGRRDEEPPWWRRRLAEIAESLREQVAMTVTDRCFEMFGGDADIAWFGVAEPVVWEGLVTLREPDPARFPGRVDPFTVTLMPGRGALLPNAHLLFDMTAGDAWAALASVARSCGTAPPREQLVYGWADHRNVRVGRGLLAVSTERGPNEVEHVAEVFARRPAGWAGNPPLRLRLDGIDLLDEPAEGVVWLLAELGHEVERRGRRWRVPGLGLVLWERDAGPEDGRFGAVSLGSLGTRWGSQK